MLWLYWRRSRRVVGLAGATLGALTALVLVANMVAEGGRRPAPPATVGGRSGSLAKLPSASDPDVRHGVALMAAAAAACRTVSYQGVQIVAWTSPEGSSSYLLDIWHRSGQPELTKNDGDSDDDGNSSARVPGTSSGASVGVLSITPAMLSLLHANYVIEYAGLGSANSRPAEVVTIRRHDGTLAARYWLDRSTSLPLRREMYDHSGNRVSEGAFINLTIGDSEVRSEPTILGPAWSPYTPAASRKRGSHPTRTRLLALHASGWPVRRTLAGNMALAGVTSTATPSGEVLDASYSDGLSVVSVFMERGRLSGRLPGWHRSRIAGLTVYATASGDLDEQGLAWSADGVVFTVIADAPPGKVTEIVAELPHERAEGFWPRVGRGLKRIGSWFDPFG
jgi:sigma-E factor negative regulatory protein RseB